MGTKQQLANKLQLVIGIKEDYLTNSYRIRSATVATHMGWMAGRTTTRIEDIGHSMLGIFGINMTVQYGEGKQAFTRLQRTLVETSTDELIFAWTRPADGLKCFQTQKPGSMPPPFSPSGKSTWGMLAPSPDRFENSTNVVVIDNKVIPRVAGWYRWVQQGVRLPMLLESNNEFTNFWGYSPSEIELPLNCWMRIQTKQSFSGWPKRTISAYGIESIV